MKIIKAKPFSPMSFPDDFSNSRSLCYRMQGRVSENEILFFSEPFRCGNFSFLSFFLQRLLRFFSKFIKITSLNFVSFCDEILVHTLTYYYYIHTVGVFFIEIYGTFERPCQDFRIHYSSSVQ